MDQFLNANIPEPPQAPEAPGAPPDGPPEAPPGPPGPPDEIFVVASPKAASTPKPAPAPMSSGGLLDGLKSAKLKPAEVVAKPQAPNGFMTPEVIARMRAIEMATKSDDNLEDDDVWSDDD